MFDVPVLGLVVDGIDDTPYVTATLSRSARTGYTLSILFASPHGEPVAAEFESVATWAREHSVPDRLWFHTADRQYTLFGCTYLPAARTQLASNLIEFRVGIRYLVSDFYQENLNGSQSTLLAHQTHTVVDTLTYWLDLDAYKYDLDNDYKGFAVRYEPKELTIPTGPSPGFQLTVSGVATGSTSVRTIHLDTANRLTTTSEHEEPIDLHLQIHDKLHALVGLVTGIPPLLRSLKITSDALPFTTLAGNTTARATVGIGTTQITRNSTQQEPTSAEINARCLAPFSLIGLDGLVHWASIYDDWATAFEPFLTIIEARNITPGTKTMLLNTALEKAGKLIGQVDGEEETYSQSGKAITRTSIFRVLAASNIDWAPFGESQAAIATAIANNYNSIKHDESSESTPHQVHTYAYGRIAEIALQGLAVSLSSREEISIISETINNKAPYNFTKHFLETNGLFINWIGDDHNKAGFTTSE